MTNHDQPTCAMCGQPITPEERDYCLAQAKRFNGLVFCEEHQRRFNACPAVRWQRPFYNFSSETPHSLPPGYLV